jgi:hypothetical protein
LADKTGMSQVAVPTAGAERRFRWPVVVATVTVIVVLAVLGAGVASWVARSNEDPFASAPELGQRVWEYTQVPLIGATSQVGKVEVVTMAVTRLTGNRWGVHLILRSEGALPRYDTRVAVADNVTTTSTCATSGGSGWGDCYVALSGSLGSTVNMNLWLNREVVGQFPILLQPWGSAG